jgi:hypothetical protein
MPPEMKRKLTMVANDLRIENQLAGMEKWPPVPSRERAGFGADANSFTLQLMNLQNALSRANRTDH